MNNDINLLITISDGHSLFKVALKTKMNMLTPVQVRYWGEPENNSKIKSLLPKHVASCGNIVYVEELFEITVRN